MAVKDMLDSEAAKASKPGAKAPNEDKGEQKKNMPCKKSLPT